MSRILRSRFAAVPVWVYQHPDVTPTTLQVYVALAIKASLDERRQLPKGVQWIIGDSGLKRAAVYACLATLRDIGALTNRGDNLFLPTDEPEERVSATMDTPPRPSTAMDTESTTADAVSATVESLPLVVREPLEEPTETRDPWAAFEDLWAAFPPRRGRKIGRADAVKAWARMTQAERAAALAAVGNYAAACAGPHGQLAQDAHRWLAHKRWEDWTAPADGQTEGAPGPMQFFEASRAAAEQAR